MIFHVWLDVRLIKQLIDPTLMTTAAAPELSWRLCHYHTISSTNMFTLSRWWQKRWQMSINQLPRIYVGLKYYQLGTKCVEYNTYQYMCGNSHCMLSGDCGTDSMTCPKPWFAWETPRFWRVFNLGFSHNVCPNLVLMNFEKPYRPRVLGVKKTVFLINTPRF